MPVYWSNQYALLGYINDNIFSNVMGVIGSDKFFLVIKNLPNGKAVGIFGILNELWKHEDMQVLCAGVFVNDTIWVGNCLMAMQYILNIVSKFFLINNIAINTDKMVAIPINQGARGVLLSISGSKISIAKKGIFFSMNSLSKPSLAKAHSDIRFFSNLPIIGYRLQFSCVSKGVCEKWDRMLRKSLKLKTNLSKDFLNEALYHSELYSLRTFGQVLVENLLAGLVKFTNADRILGELFEHRAMKLQTVSWMLWHPLKFLIKLLVNPVNCFLAGTIHALKLCNLSLGSDLPNVFRAGNRIAVLDVLGFESYLGIAKSLRRYGVMFTDQFLDCCDKCFMWNTFCRWKKLDPRGPVPVWFASLVKFIIESGLLNSVLLSSHFVPTDFFCNFGYIGEHLLNSGLGSITVYTDGCIKNLGLVRACGGAAIYFLDVDTSVEIKADLFLEMFVMLPKSYSILFTLFVGRPDVLIVLLMQVSCCVSNTSVILYEDASSSLASGQKKKNNVLLGTSVNRNAVTNSLNKAATFIDLFTALAKGFVLKSWVVNMLGHLGVDSNGNALVVDFVCHFAKSHRSAVWLPAAKLRAYYEKYNLLPCDAFLFFQCLNLGV
ncbi:hypothetical protein G9A89_006144 [Geosiphon pyriformis]|nr:hypothetical protein G9A89_006144 [Geosiphon pyriformis]